MREQAAYSVAVLAAAVLLLAATAAAQPKTRVASSQISIHEQGTFLNDPNASIVKRNPHGTFTIEIAGGTSGARGTTVIFPDPGVTKYVNGQAQISFAGSDTLTNKIGELVLAFDGTHISVNNKLASNAVAVGPAVEYGTWKVKSATGAYKGWKGGGNWAAAIYDYGHVQPYSVQWDGNITR